MLRPTGLGSGNAAQQLGAPYCLSREADRAGEASAPAGEGQRGRSSSVLARLRSARTAWVLRRAQAASPCVMALDSEHPFIVGFRGFAYISDAQMTTMPDREHVHVRLLPADLHGITGYEENNGNVRGRRLGGERGRGGHRKDEGYLAAH